MLKLIFLLTCKVLIVQHFLCTRICTFLHITISKKQALVVERELQLAQTDAVLAEKASLAVQLLDVLPELGRALTKLLGLPHNSDHEPVARISTVRAVILALSTNKNINPALQITIAASIAESQPHTQHLSPAEHATLFEVLARNAVAVNDTPKAYADAWRAMAALIAARESLSVESLEILAETLWKISYPHPASSAAAPLLKTCRYAIALAPNRRITEFVLQLMLAPLQLRANAYYYELAASYIVLDNLCKDSLLREHAWVLLDYTKEYSTGLGTSDVEFGATNLGNDFGPSLFANPAPWVLADAESRALSQLALSSEIRGPYHLHHPLLSSSLFTCEDIGKLYTEGTNLDFWHLVQLGRLSSKASAAQLESGWLAAAEQLNGEIPLTSSAFFCLGSILYELKLRGNDERSSAIRLLDLLIHRIQASVPCLTSGAIFFLQKLESRPRLLTPRMKAYKEALAKWFANALKQRLEKDAKGGETDLYRAFGAHFQPKYDWDPAQTEQTFVQIDETIVSFFQYRCCIDALRSTNPASTRIPEYVFLLSQANISLDQDLNAPERGLLESEVKALYCLSVAASKSPIYEKISSLIRPYLLKVDKSHSEFQPKELTDLLDYAFLVFKRPTSLYGYNIDIWKLEPDLVVLKKWVNTCFKSYTVQRCPLFIQSLIRLLRENQIYDAVPALYQAISRAVLSQGPFSPNRVFLASLPLPANSDSFIKEFLAASSERVCRESLKLFQNPGSIQIYDLTMFALKTHGSQFAAELAACLGPLLDDLINTIVAIASLPEPSSEVLNELARYYDIPVKRLLQKTCRPVLAAMAASDRPYFEFLEFSGVKRWTVSGEVPPIAISQGWVQDDLNKPAFDVLKLAENKQVKFSTGLKIEVIRALPLLMQPEVYLSEDNVPKMDEHEAEFAIVEFFKGAAELFDINAQKLACARAQFVVRLCDCANIQKAFCREVLLTIQRNMKHGKQIDHIMPYFKPFDDLEIVCWSKNLGLSSENPQNLYAQLNADIPLEIVRCLLFELDHAEDFGHELDAKVLAAWCKVLGHQCSTTFKKWLAERLIDSSLDSLGANLLVVTPPQTEVDPVGNLVNFLLNFSRIHGYEFYRLVFPVVAQLKHNFTYTSSYFEPETCLHQAHLYLKDFSYIDLTPAFECFPGFTSESLVYHLELALANNPRKLSEISRSLATLLDTGEDLACLLDISHAFRKKGVDFMSPNKLLRLSSNLRNLSNGLLFAELIWSGGKLKNYDLRDQLIYSSEFKRLAEMDEDLQDLYASTDLKSMGSAFAPWKKFVFDVALAEAEPELPLDREFEHDLAEADANRVSQVFSGPFKPVDYQLAWKLSLWDLPLPESESTCDEAIYTLFRRELSSQSTSLNNLLVPAIDQMLAGDCTLMRLMQGAKGYDRMLETYCRVSKDANRLAFTLSQRSDKCLASGERETALVHALKLENLAISEPQTKRLAEFTGAKVAWSFGEHRRAIAMMSKTISTKPGLVSLFTAPQCLKVSKTDSLLCLASWSQLARHATAETVSESYLKPAIAYASSQDEKVAALSAYANFSEQQANSAELEAEEAAAARLSSVSDPDGALQASQVASKRARYKLTALSMYLQAISITGTHTSHCGARAIAIWLAEHEDLTIQQRFKQFLPTIPSEALLPWANQLASSLSLAKSLFQQNLVAMLLKLAAQYPFAVAWRLFALRAFVNDAGKERAEAANPVWIAAKKLSSDSSAKFSAVSKLGRAILDLAQRTPKTKISTQSLSDAAGSQYSQFWQHEISSLEIPLPTGNEDSVILSVEPRVQIASGLSRPRILSVLLSDGQKAQMLVKGGHDDPRQDSVMQQVFSHANLALASSNLEMKTYAVVPVGPQAGAIEFVSGTQSLQEVLAKAHLNNDSPNWTAVRAKEMMIESQQGSKETRLRVFDEICENINPSLRHFFFQQYPSAEEWYKKRQEFVRTCAVSSIVGYILGLGDRHCSNILLNEGAVIHIDLGVAFDAGKRLKVPETVPFRLSRDIVDGFGISGVRGLFTKCAITTLVVLKQHQDELQTVLDVLRYDPLYNWRSRHELKTSEDQRGSATAERALHSVRKKLNSELSVEAQVRELIGQAQSRENLAMLYAGWQSFY